MNMNSLQNHLEKVYVFSVVARTGSFRQAAQVLRISQPSLSRTVKILEDAVEQPLLHRSRQGVRLTKAGQTLYDFSGRIAAEIERVDHRLRTSNAILSAKLIVGSHESIAIRVWPSFVSTIAKKHPGIAMSLKTGCSNSLMGQNLLQSALDLAVTVGMLDHPEISSRKLYGDCFGLYISPTAFRQAYGKFTKLRIAAAAEVPFILVPNATYEDGKTLDQLAQSLGLFRRQMTYELDSFEAAKEFIIQGVGLGLLPRWIAGPAVRDRSIVEIQLKDLPAQVIGSHTIYAASRKSDQQDPVMRMVLQETELFFGNGKKSLLK